MLKKLTLRRLKESSGQSMVKVLKISLQLLFGQRFSLLLRVVITVVSMEIRHYQVKSILIVVLIEEPYLMHMKKQ